MPTIITQHGTRLAEMYTQGETGPHQGVTLLLQLNQRRWSRGRILEGTTARDESPKGQALSQVKKGTTNIPGRRCRECTVMKPQRRVDHR